MASKKGIVVTAIILAAITGASFLLWIVPQDVETTFVVSDYEKVIMYLLPLTYTSTIN